MTLELARKLDYAVFFLASLQVAESFATEHTKITGRHAVAFTETYKGFTLHCAATAPRPHPVVKVMLPGEWRRDGKDKVC